MSFGFARRTGQCGNLLDDGSVEDAALPPDPLAIEDQGYAAIAEDGRRGIDPQRSKQRVQRLDDDILASHDLVEHENKPPRTRPDHHSVCASAVMLIPLRDLGLGAGVQRRATSEHFAQSNDRQQSLAPAQNLAFMVPFHAATRAARIEQLDLVHVPLRNRVGLPVAGQKQARHDRQR